MKTKTEIIEETVDNYRDPTRRAKGDCYCVYLTEDGRKCAFGRCEINPPSKGEKGYSEDVYRRFESDKEMDLALKPEYRGHSRKFWGKIQRLHDSDIFWNCDGLSAGGYFHYQALVREFYWSDKISSLFRLTKRLFYWKISPEGNSKIQ